MREGESVDLHFVGQPADLAFVMFSPLSGYALLPQYQGTLLVPPTSPLFAVGTVPASDTLLGGGTDLIALDQAF